MKTRIRILVILLGGSFAFLDRRIFGDDSGTVTILRILIILVSLLIIGSTLRKKTEKFHDWNAFIFILMIGMFCIYLISLSDSAIFTPYFTGLFFAFTGVFTIPGLGFRYSFFALLINVILFELYFGLFNPMPSLNFLVYNFFLLGMVFIFVYLGYLIEGVSRRNFVTAARLQDSLDEVKTLSGLLPICSQCKNIRDDKGYWQQVETYIRHHSDAEFTHGICPDCAKNLYSDQVWYQQMPQSARDKILKQ